MIQSLLMRGNAAPGKPTLACIIVYCRTVSVIVLDECETNKTDTKITDAGHHYAKYTYSVVHYCISKKVGISRKLDEAKRLWD